MPRAARLTNIANGLCGAFASRNNDLDGYWSIGKLRSLAAQDNGTTVSIDVLNSSMQPSFPEFAPVLACHRSLLAKLAACSGVRLENIAAARIVIDFSPSSWPGAGKCEPHAGEPFGLTVCIEADGRAAGVARHAGCCRPHDPARERRSARASVAARA